MNYQTSLGGNSGSRNPQQLLNRLLKCASAAEVEKIIKAEGYSDSDWVPYGERDNNWSTVSNQQSSAVGALTELVINSIDAVLCRKVRESGVKNVSGPEAPPSMQDAVKLCYPEANEGKLYSLEPRELGRIAEKSVLIGIRKSKSRKCPTITVVDCGEGQEPAKFPETFLSLDKKNKEGIPFVQGKFNMGSTGSIRFCTEGNILKGHYKLIASKRYDTSMWGWTLIRVDRVQEGKKLPVAKYLMPDGRIPQFAGGSIEAFGHEKIGKIEEGSVVKLFDYAIGEGAHAVIFGLYEALTFNLLDCALPIRIHDFRAKPREARGEFSEQGIDSRTFSGMTVRLSEDFEDASRQDPDIREEKPEERTTEFRHLVGDESNPDLGKVKIFAIGLSEMQDFMAKDNRRIFYTINGQTHASEKASVLNQKRVKLGSLQNHLIVDVQCEKMDTTALSMFMGDRERMAKVPLSDNFVNWSGSAWVMIPS